MSWTDTVVLDRIVDGETAVLIVEDDGEQSRQVDLDVTDLPPDGRHEGAVFQVTVGEGAIQDAEYLPEAEREQRQSAQDRFDSLSEGLDS